MKKISQFILVLAIVFVEQKIFAQEGTTAAPKPKAATRLTRQSISIEYFNWLENLTLKTLTNEIGFKAMLYGLGVSYDQTTFRQRDGWGWTAGVINGYGIAGSQSSDYFQNRVRLLAGHAGFRYFWRINSRFDLGPMGTLIYKNIQWPAAATNQELQPGPNPLAGAWMDSRFRLSTKWQLTQAVGVLQTNASMAWRLGAAYTF
ncbi:MAG: hypothetical protein ACK5P5_06050 [Pseudobdellovibrionaceae bacterium]